MSSSVALINTNQMKPAIGPIGLDYVAEALHEAGHKVSILDLCWEDDPLAAIEDFFAAREVDLVGATLRNTDDCAFTSRVSFVGDFRDMIAKIRGCTDAPIVVGGVGFSVIPELVLEHCGADAGVWGEGELTLPLIADRIGDRSAFFESPNLVLKNGRTWRRTATALSSLTALPTMTRRWFDNRRYFNAGGQAGFETKRGCPGRCIYCVDPVAKGHTVRLRPPKAVVDEVAHLLDLGIDHLHTCDAEFNMPTNHAIDVCTEITDRGLGDALRWYAYCTPSGFTPELARAMRRAGCVGINFGADSGDSTMLTRLGRDFNSDDITVAVRTCKTEGIAVMLDLLLGGPGESQESLIQTVELMRQIEPDRVGMTVGVRVYPGTALAERAAKGELDDGLVGGDDVIDPPFFIDTSVAPFIFDLLERLIGDDPRFLFFDPSKPNSNYNYNSNERLVSAIEAGHRGAYWDILRRSL